MKAIINVAKGNQYSVFNGTEFEIKEVLSYGVSVVGINQEYPNNKVDFSFDEIKVKAKYVNEFLSKYYTIFTVGCDTKLAEQIFGKLSINLIENQHEKFTDFCGWFADESFKFKRGYEVDDRKLLSLSDYLKMVNALRNLKY